MNYFDGDLKASCTDNQYSKFVKEITVCNKYFS